MKYALALFAVLSFNVAAAEQPTTESAKAPPAKCVAKTKDGKCLTLKEVQALIEAGVDISDLLPPTAAGEGSEGGGVSVSSSYSGSNFGAAPISSFGGGGGGAISRN